MKIPEKIIMWLLALAFSTGGAWTLLAEVPSIKTTHEKHLADDRIFRESIENRVTEIMVMVRADKREQDARWDEVLRRLDRIERKVDR